MKYCVALSFHSLMITPLKVTGLCFSDYLDYSFPNITAMLVSANLSEPKVNASQRHGILVTCP